MRVPAPKGLAISSRCSSGPRNGLDSQYLLILTITPATRPLHRLPTDTTTNEITITTTLGDAMIYNNMIPGGITILGESFNKVHNFVVCCSPLYIVNIQNDWKVSALMSYEPVIITFKL